MFKATWILAVSVMAATACLSSEAPPPSAQAEQAAEQADELSGAVDDGTLIDPAQAPSDGATIERTGARPASTCTNNSYRTAGKVGCCNQTTNRYAEEICIYGTWYSTSRTTCVQNTSYCVCEGNTGSCGG